MEVQKLPPLPRNPVMMVHQITGTYLVCDNYSDATRSRVQTWALDPFNDTNSHVWYLTPVDATKSADCGYHTVHIESSANRQRLTAGTGPNDPVNFQAPLSSIKKYQQWQLWPWEQISIDSYTIVSVAHNQYALAIQTHTQANDQLINLTRMWGSKNLSQAWKVFYADTGAGDGA